MAGRTPRGLAAAAGIIAAGAGCAGAPTAADTADPSDAAPVGLSVGWTEAACDAAEVDRDRDGVDERCELALARAFAPELVASPAACNWIADASPARLGGGYRFAAARDRSSGALRIAYLPAYFRDCGWDGLKCRLPFVGCEGHTGDSEAIVVEVAWMQTVGRWRTTAVFLSAHCFGRSDASCRWYRGRDLYAFAWVDDRPRGAPVVWVAEGSNANYPSKGACERGHRFLDTCERNEPRTRFPVPGSDRNIGSRQAPVVTAHGRGCIGTEHLGPAREHGVAGRWECFWSADAPFHGWQWPPTGEPPTPYVRYLTEIAGF